jgi:multiple sugar transport system substrate-binding protein
MKRFIAGVSLLLILSCALVFAGGDQQGAQAGSSEKPTPVLFWINEDPTGDYKKLVDEYNRLNPNVFVDMQIVPGGVTDVTKLMTAVRGGTGPDVYFLDRFTIGERAAGGLLEDITADLLKLDSNIKDKYLDFAWAETQFRGKTYGLPFRTDTRAIFYRKDILRQAGIDLSILDPANGPCTIDQLNEIAMKLNKTDSEGNYTQVGRIPFLTEEQGFHYMWAFGFGAEMADLKAGRVTPTEPASVATFQYLKDSCRALGPQKIRTFISTYMPPNYPPQQHPFLTGNLPMMLNGDWYVTDINKYAKDIEWGTTWLPVLKKGDQPHSFAGGWSIVVPTGVKQRAEAVKFIHWFAGEPGQRLFIKNIGGTTLPTIKTVLNDTSLYPPEFMFLREMLPVSKNRPVLPVGALYFDNLTVAQNKVTYDQGDVAAALKKCEDDTNAQLSKFLPLN